MPSCKPLYRVRREQQRPHLRSHRRGLGRLLGADVAPQAGRAQRSPSDGTLQHRHPAAVRTGGAWSAGTPRSCGSGPPTRRSPATGTRTPSPTRSTSGPSPRPRPAPRRRSRYGTARRTGAVTGPGARTAEGTAARPAAQAPARRRPGTGSAGPSGGTRSASAGGCRRARPRSKVLARRRRTTMVLFIAFTLGAVVAAVGGLALPVGAGRSGRAAERVHRASARPGAAPLRLHHGPAPGRGRRAAAARAPAPAAAARRPRLPPSRTRSPERADPGLSALAADGAAPSSSRRTTPSGSTSSANAAPPGHGDSWDPVPVPLPTYVTAPVAPRATGGVDVGDPDTWSSARSSPGREPTADEPAGRRAGRTPDAPRPTRRPEPAPPTPAARLRPRARDRGRTPLFDQYDDEDRPRAANE